VILGIIAHDQQMILYVFSRILLEGNIRSIFPDFNGWLVDYVFLVCAD
jgi:hypothetical protein